jgi:hypothetical protein
MNEVVTFQSAGQPGTDILFKIDLDVVGFPPVNGRNFSHESVFLVLNYNVETITIVAV